MGLASGIRLGHVNLEVTRLATARRFYDRFLPVLGFRRVPRTGPVWLGYRKGSVTLWITVSRPRRTVRRPPRVPTDGATDPISDHLGFWVPSTHRLEEIERRLRGKGLRPVYPLDRVATRGSTWYISSAWRDPDENVLELYTVARR